MYRGLVDHYRLARGPKHSDTLMAIHNLGAVLENQKKYAEAERLFRECWELRREVDGALHPETLMAQFNLGYVLNDLGRRDEAEVLMRQCLESRRQVLGPDHPHTLCTISELGLLLYRRGALDDAESLLQPCLKAQRQALGPKNHHTIRTAGHLDGILKERAKIAAAKSSRPRPSVFQSLRLPAEHIMFDAAKSILTWVSQSARSPLGSSGRGPRRELAYTQAPSENKVIDSAECTCLGGRGLGPRDPGAQAADRGLAKRDHSHPISNSRSRYSVAAPKV